MHRSPILGGNHPGGSDLRHGIRDEVSDLVIPVGTDGGYTANIRVGGDGLRHGLEMVHHLLHREVDAAFDIDRVRPGGGGAVALGEDGAREQGGGGGAIPRDVVGGVGDLPHELCPEVFKFIREFDRFRDRDPVFGDFGGTVGLFKEDIAAAGAKSDGDGFGEFVHTVEHGLTGFLTKENVFAFGGEEALGDVHYRSRSGNFLLKWF